MYAMVINYFYICAEIMYKGLQYKYTASPPFFYNNTNNYIIIKIKYLLELKIELKNKYILI